MVTLEAILERNNLNRAYKQVKANRGGPGVDGMTVDELLDYLRAHAVERERQKFCVHGIIGARQTGASNEHEHQTQFS